MRKQTTVPSFEATIRGLAGTPKAEARAQVKKANRKAASAGKDKKGER